MNECIVELNTAHFSTHTMLYTVPYWLPDKEMQQGNAVCKMFQWLPHWHEF